MQDFVALILVLYSIVSAIDLVAAVSAWRHKLFTRAPVIIVCVYLRLIGVLLIAIWTAVGTYWYHVGEPDCLDDPSGLFSSSIPKLQQLLLSIVVINWIGLGLFLNATYCAYSDDATHPGRRLATCESRIRCISCYCCWGESSRGTLTGSEVFEKVARVMES